MKAKYKHLFYNLILLSVILVLCLMTAAGATRLDSVSLDQRTRCGQQAHTHTESCYHGELLLCNQKVHLHSNNCYLVLLEDNDINRLLQNMQAMGGGSLEAIIDSTMIRALNLNEDFSCAVMPLVLSSQDINVLNATIEENHIEPLMVLNENLATGNTLLYSLDTGAATIAVGGSPSTTTRAVNFYIQLDGNIVFINSGKLTNSKPDYYSYSNTVSAYTSVVNTGLTTSGINRSYYFRYNTTGKTTAASNFSTSATYQSSNVQFNNVSNARYALLCDKTNTPVAFYTVGLDYTAVDTTKSSQIEYVEAGRATGLSLSDEYLWYDADGNRVTQMPATITETTIYYASPKAYTATFVDANNIQVADPYSAEPTGGTLQVSLPSLMGTQWEGYCWTIQNTDGSLWYPSDGSATVEITGDTVFVAVPGSYTITFLGADGTEESREISYRGTVTFGTLPEGWVWEGSDGSKYLSGETSPSITKNVTFTAVEVTLTIHYNVNFPASAASDVDTAPTLYGTDSATATDYTSGGRGVMIRNLSSRTARDEISTSNKESITYFFENWSIVGSDKVVEPDATMRWSDLAKYADENGNVYLEGVWALGNRYNSVTFFVRFDSAAVDTEGNIISRPTENYTPEVFNSHVGGVDTSVSDSVIKKDEIADTTSDNSYTADRNIRALYGEKTTGIWIYDFPTDDHVFGYLKQYLADNPGKQLTVDGEVVDSTQLDYAHYAIRWYVFKLEGSTWHVDGKLVKRTGVITVDKSFGGDDSALTAAQNGFYIVAENGAMDENGVFTAFAADDAMFKMYVLVLDQTTADALADRYPGAVFLHYNTETEKENGYEWLLTNITLGEYWHIEEFPVDVAGYGYYAEYSVFDTDGENTTIAKYGTKAAVAGKTFALDEDPDQGMMVSFHNYYYPKETILIKKEDSNTGQPIGGAAFSLWQNGELLTFNYNDVIEQYEYDENGSGQFSQIVTSADGFATLSTKGFSYDNGDVVFKEVLSPAGYGQVPDITVGKDGGGSVVLKGVAGIDAADWSGIAQLPNDNVVVIKNSTAEHISVTVNKVWNTGAPADSVEVVLYANGHHAATILPGLADAQVVLNESNLWTHTWQDLPQYANGQIVQWSVKEVKIGDKTKLSDGVTFADWTVTYSPGVGTDTDDDGDIDNWRYTVINSARRAQLILTKTGTDGVILPGSVFSLEQVTLVDGQWQPVSDTTADVQTTDSNGMLTFDNLLESVYYRLSELSASDGYLIGFEPVVLTMDAEGNIQKVLSDGSFATLYDPLVQVTRPYNIQVINIKMTPLPETGGRGMAIFLHSGTVLMLAAAALWLYRKKCKEERENSS